MVFHVSFAGSLPSWGRYSLGSVALDDADFSTGEDARANDNDFTGDGVKDANDFTGDGARAANDFTGGDGAKGDNDFTD